MLYRCVVVLYALSAVVVLTGGRAVVRGGQPGSSRACVLVVRGGQPGSSSGARMNYFVTNAWRSKIEMTCTVALPNATVGYSMISIKVNRDSVCMVLVWSGRTKGAHCFGPVELDAEGGRLRPKLTREGIH